MVRSYGGYTEPLRSKHHLRRLGTIPCYITKDDVKGGLRCNQPAIPHHYTFVNEGGMGKKVGDDKCISLCHFHHMELHRMGEKRFWINHGFSRVELMRIAEQLWRESHVRN